jgi:hypothetical protein
MFEWTQEEYRKLFQKYKKRPKVSVYPSQSEYDWELYRKIGEFGIFNPDINPDNKLVSNRIFYDIWNFMEFQKWREHRMALYNILSDYGNNLPKMEGFDDLELTNEDLFEKIKKDPEKLKKYWHIYKNAFNDFDEEIKRDDLS